MEKRYDHTISEPDTQKKWATEQTYYLTEGTGAIYSIDTPPPTVSGSLHIGHVFSYTQTDIIARYKRMNGFRVFYPFGYDGNGLATERYVEKKRKVRAHQIPRSEFIALCLEETEEAAKMFSGLWQRMGLSADWRNTYSTISDDVRRISQESFLRLLEKGLVYRRDEPAPYCVSCRTSVAQAELDDKSLPSHFNDIVFKDEDGNDLIIGTTRPELLPSCVSLFYHPADDRYQHLRYKKAIVPLFGHEVPILEDEHVDPEKGTGLVMCCTFGDKADVEWYKKYNLPYRQSVGFDGKWVEGTGILAGLKAKEARETILEELKKQDLLQVQESITHAVGVHERCQNEIEFIVLRQWFVSITQGKQRYLDLADQINWHPSFMKARYIDWVQKVGWDWCISRQRFYGIPFPVWHCSDCSEVLLAKKEDLPIDPQESPYPGKTCTKCNGSNIVPETDVMDTWNTSSITPYICASLLQGKVLSLDDTSLNTFLPMSMRPQAHDIIRTWAFYTIIKTWMHHERVPWHDIVISGHVLSSQKEKLSKSKDNSAMAPEKLLERYPADAIRYWAASGSLGHDIAFSESQLKIGLRLITKLWNAFRFTKEHIETAQTSLPEGSLGTVNEWILHRATESFEKYHASFEQHEFGAALHIIERFFWHDFCDNYLELIKNQLFHPQDYQEQEVVATRWTLQHVGLRILQLYAPYIPHVTETIYGQVYSAGQGTSLHLTQYADIQQPYNFSESSQIMQLVIHVVDAVRKLKSEHQLSLKTLIASLAIQVQNETVAEQLKPHEQLIAGITQAHKIGYVIGQAGTNTLKLTEDVWHATVTLDRE